MVSDGSGATVPEGGWIAPVRRHPLRDWRTPLLITIGMALTVVVINAFGGRQGALVLGGAMAMSFARNRLVTSWRGRAEAIILLPVVALATWGVGELIIAVPALGAAAFVAAMFLSIWLRRFGPLWRRVGSLIALPFITLLIVPGGGAGTTPMATVLVSLLALVVVVVVRVLAEIARFIPATSGTTIHQPPRSPEKRDGEKPGKEAGEKSGKEAGDKSGEAAGENVAEARTSGNLPGAAETPTKEPTPSAAGSAGKRQSSMRPIASTRMAIQMAAALVVGIAAGVLLFPAHITWVVLTAFLVNSGNRGRGDVLHKSGLRIVGAIAGTFAASALLIVEPHGNTLIAGPTLVAVVLVILTLGFWLRSWTYAAWALAMTLVITLLQGAVIPIPHGSAAGVGLWMRVLAIVVGAAIGLASAWFILPVRSINVMRGRISDALRALSDFAFDPDRGAATSESLTTALAALDELSPAWRAHHRVSRLRRLVRVPRGAGAVTPARWVMDVHACAALVAVIAVLDGASRRALGEARRAVRDANALGPALDRLRATLQTQRGSEAGGRMEA